MVPADSTLYALTLLAVLMRTSLLFPQKVLLQLEKRHLNCKKENLEPQISRVMLLESLPTFVPYQIRVNKFLICSSKFEPHCLQGYEHTSKSNCSQHSFNQ